MNELLGYFIIFGILRFKNECNANIYFIISFSKERSEESE